MSYIVKYSAANNEVRAIGINGTAIVAEAAKRHNMSPLATAALGRGMMGALMLATSFKRPENKLTLRIFGDGPLGGMLINANGKLEVRGYVQEPQLELPLSPQGKLDVGGAVGKNGLLHITKDLQLKEPYTGTSQLVSGEIGEDLANYLFHSEQTPSIVALGVLVDRDYSVAQAGGYLIQLLPGASEATVSKLEERVTLLESITNVMQRGLSIEEILVTHVLTGLEPVKLLSSQPAHFGCDCSKEKLERTMISLGEKELQEIIDEQEEAELTCSFCNEKHCFSKDDLLKLVHEINR